MPKMLELKLTECHPTATRHCRCNDDAVVAAVLTSNPYSEQRTYLDKVKQERQVKEEAMSQDEEEDIPVTEKEMSLKVRCIN